MGQHHHNYNPKYEACILENLIQELQISTSVMQYMRFSCQGEATPFERQGLDTIDCYGNKDLLKGWCLTGPYPKFVMKKGQTVLTPSNISSVMKQRSLKPIATRSKASTSSSSSYYDSDSFYTLINSLPANSTHCGLQEHLESCQKYRENKERHLMPPSNRTGYSYPVMTEEQKELQKQIKHDLIKEMEKLRLKEQQLEINNNLLAETNKPEMKRLKHTTKTRRLGSKDSLRSLSSSHPSTPIDMITKTSLKILQDNEESIVIKSINGCVKPVTIPVLTCSLSFDYEKFRDRIKQLEQEIKQPEDKTLKELSDRWQMQKNERTPNDSQQQDHKFGIDALMATIEKPAVYMTSKEQLQQEANSSLNVTSKNNTTLQMKQQHRSQRQVLTKPHNAAAHRLKYMQQHRLQDTESIQPTAQAVSIASHGGSNGSKM